MYMKMNIQTELEIRSLVDGTFPLIMSRTPELSGRYRRLYRRSRILSGTWGEEVPDNESYRNVSQKISFTEGFH